MQHVLMTRGGKIPYPTTDPMSSPMMMQQQQQPQQTQPMQTQVEAPTPTTQKRVRPEKGSEEAKEQMRRVRQNLKR